MKGFSNKTKNKEEIIKDEKHINRIPKQKNNISLSIKSLIPGRISLVKKDKISI
tara:strand:- start:191 stop:352 length:162 start_codon:yes stop_codon:yes gene_type:complete